MDFLTAISFVGGIAYCLEKIFHAVHEMCGNQGDEPHGKHVPG